VSIEKRANNILFIIANQWISDGSNIQILWASKDKNHISISI